MRSAPWSDSAPMIASHTANTRNQGMRFLSPLTIELSRLRRLVKPAMAGRLQAKG
jgi:hypothetical protein